MGVPLVALGVRPPDIANPLDQYGKAVQLKSMIEQQKLIPGQLEAQQQNIEAGRQEIEQRRIAMEQQQAVNEAYRSSVKVDANGQPNIDTDSLGKALASSGHGSAIPGILEGVAKYQETRGNLMKQQQALQEGSADLLGYAAAAVKDAKYDPHLAHTILDTLGDSPQIKQVRQLIDTNPDAFKQQIDAAISQSPAQQKLANERQVATIRASKPPEGELPLQNVDQMNQGLQSRYQVLHPNAKLPSQFTLPTNATQKDFDHVDKLLTQTEQATGVKAQQDAAAIAREQARQDRLDSKQDKIEKEGIQPVTGTDPVTGKDVLVPMSQAKEMKLANVTKADADIVNKSTAARHWVTLADKQGDTPDNMGILQLVDKLDAEGKLGTVTSRWNDFLAGKVGSGDPEFTALRTKIALGNTKLMQAHVGSRGGSFMLEHFEDLANAKKMDGPTLKAGVTSELDYMKDVAMQPDKPGAKQAAPSAAPANVAKALANVGPGVHKLSDGSTWMKAADGKISKQ